MDFEKVDLSCEFGSYLFDPFNFEYNARFITNYITRNIKTSEFAGESEFEKLTIRLYPEGFEANSSYSRFSKTLYSCITASDEEQLRYKSITDPEDRYEYILSVLEKGYNNADPEYHVPIQQLLDIHNKFRENGYKNEWIWKQIKVKEYSLCIDIICRFTAFDFTLNIEVYDIKHSKPVTGGCVFRMGPKESYFEYLFKKVSVKDSYLYVYDLWGMPKFSFDLQLLSEGSYNVNYLGEEGPDDDIKLIQRITW